MKSILLAIFLLPALTAAQTVDLTGTWRMTTHDDVANARPTVDESHWQTITLPLLRTRLPEGSWLRRTAEVLPGADTLAVGTLPPSAFYLNGIKQKSSPSDPMLYALPPGARSIVVAIRIGDSGIPGPNQVTVDYGPYLIAARANAAAAVKTARFNLTRQLGPFALLGGVQLTLAIAIVLIWFVTARGSRILPWLAAYMLYACHNLLRLSFFTGLPPSPRYIATTLSVQIALAIARKDSLRNTVTLWSAYGLLLAFTGHIFSGQAASTPTGYINTLLITAALAIMMIGAWRTKEVRPMALAGCLYWFWPLFGAVTRNALIFETSAGFWPVLGILNAPLTLAIVFIYMASFAEDRRERARFHNEFEAARAVQQLLLPEASLTRGNLQFDAVYQPALETGGDFYYVLEPAPGALTVIVADVAGKGLRAAMLVSLLIGVLRETRETSPAAILKSLSAALLRNKNSGFVTACCASFQSNGAMVVASAGHGNPFLNGAEIDVIPALPLGCDPDVEYEECPFLLDAGEQVTFVSDGVVEAANADGELFGFDRTGEISRKPPSEIAEIVRAWGQNDDITVVTVRRAA